MELIEKSFAVMRFCRSARGLPVDEKIGLLSHTLLLRAQQISALFDYDTKDFYGVLQFAPGSGDGGAGADALKCRTIQDFRG